MRLTAFTLYPYDYQQYQDGAGLGSYQDDCKQMLMPQE
jgi:hypothetical protein